MVSSRVTWRLGSPHLCNLRFTICDQLNSFTLKFHVEFDVSSAAPFTPATVHKVFPIFLPFLAPKH